MGCGTQQQPHFACTQNANHIITVQSCCCATGISSFFGRSDEQHYILRRGSSTCMLIGLGLVRLYLRPIVPDDAQIVPPIQIIALFFQFPLRLRLPGEGRSAEGAPACSRLPLQELQDRCTGLPLQGMSHARGRLTKVCELSCCAGKRLSPDRDFRT